jgi:hypothetical protein
MLDSPLTDRREFTLQSLMALLGGMTITISACGGSSSGGSPAAPTGNTGTSGDTTGAISTNHGHKATITSAALAAGTGLMLDIRGDADHPHMVELTAADISRIRSQQTVSKDSSTMVEHMHVVTFSRGSEPTGPGY